MTTQVQFPGEGVPVTTRPTSRKGGRALGRQMYGLVQRFATVCFGTALGVVLGVLVAVPLRLFAAAVAAKVFPAQGPAVCGMYTVILLFQGILLGTFFGGLTGFIASLMHLSHGKMRRQKAEPVAPPDPAVSIGSGSPEVVGAGPSR